MEKFTTLTGVAAPLPMRNVDTDMIIPKQFLKTIQRTGLGKSLFFEMRFDEAGKEVPDFVLNQTVYRGAQILATGDNFGCAPSRAQVRHLIPARLCIALQLRSGSSCVYLFGKLDDARLPASAPEPPESCHAVMTYTRTCDEFSRPRHHPGNGRPRQWHLSDVPGERAPHDSQVVLHVAHCLLNASIALMVVR